MPGQLRPPGACLQAGSGCRVLCRPLRSLACTWQARGRSGAPQGPGGLPGALPVDPVARQPPPGPQMAEKGGDGLHQPNPWGKKALGAATSPGTGRSLCITLGELLAQPPGCPQRSAVSDGCPRWRYSGNRVPRTGFGATQVLARTGKLALVHTSTPALLLRLCIYKDFKKKTENNIRSSLHGPLSSAKRGSGAKSGSALCTPLRTCPQKPALPKPVPRARAAFLRRGKARSDSGGLPTQDCAGRPPGRPRRGVG